MRVGRLECAFTITHFPLRSLSVLSAGAAMAVSLVAGFLVLTEVFRARSIRPLGRTVVVVKVEISS